MSDAMGLQLLPGEQIDLRELDSKKSRTDYHIVSEQARYQIVQIPPLASGNTWVLNPTFQRRRRWDIARQSKLIESIIINVPIPPIFLYEVELGVFEVMDGLQRLTAVTEFYNDEFELTDLEYFPELNGNRYSQLRTAIQRSIDRRYLSAVILLNETGGANSEEATHLKQLVFERINSGGVDLEYQESRNALYPGAMNDLCLELSNHPSFCGIWSIGEVIDSGGQLNVDEESRRAHDYFKKMYDVELVLRFFAYRQRQTGYPTRQSLRDFLDNYLRGANHLSPEVLAGLKEIFCRTCDLAYNLFGPEALWLRRQRKGKWEWIGQPAVLSYEPMMLSLSTRLDSAGQLLTQTGEINESLAEFYETNAAAFDGRKVNASDREQRDVLFGEFFDRFINS